MQISEIACAETLLGSGPIPAIQKHSEDLELRAGPKMGKPMSMTLKANLIGTAAILITGVYIGYEMTHEDVAKPCSTAYPPAASLDLRSGNGELLSAMALQGRSQSQDWGLIDKVTIENASDAPTKSVIKFALPKQDVSSTNNVFGGAGFPWQPSKLKGAKSVCFAYNVWLPNDFDFSATGILPGVASGQSIVKDENDDEDEGQLSSDASVRTSSWSEDGKLRLV